MNKNGRYIHYRRHSCKCLEEEEEDIINIWGLSPVDTGPLELTAINYIFIAVLNIFLQHLES